MRHDIDRRGVAPRPVVDRWLARLPSDARELGPRRVAPHLASRPLTAHEAAASPERERRL
jgi:hypothetical protein